MDVHCSKPAGQQVLSATMGKQGKYPGSLSVGARSEVHDLVRVGGDSSEGGNPTSQGGQVSSRYELCTANLRCDQSHRLVAPAGTQWSCLLIVQSLKRLQ
jgi:hypothetical protein